MNQDLSPEALLAYLANATGGQTVDEQTLLFSTGLLDSFDLAELLAFVEATSDKRIRATDVSLENFDSAVRILRYAGKRL